MHIPDEFKYTKEHEWVRIVDKIATIGITDYAQGSLGDITFVDLPKAGQTIEQFKQYATVESVKAASDVYAPVSGKIMKVNENLAAHPEFINQSPYDKGFFAQVEVADEKALSNLMSSVEYKRYVEGLA